MPLKIRFDMPEADSILDLKKQRVELEHLLFAGKPLFEFKQGEVSLYHYDHKPGPRYSLDWSISALATIVPRPDNNKLTWFKKWVEAMISETEKGSDWLNRDGTNFASWYRYISQEHQDPLNRR